MLGTLLDLALVLAGFTAIIVVHELGHFLAARWAGIRVLAFAVGFGPAVVSYRRGLGVRAGSSEREHQRLAASPEASAAISPTEYRLNLLPLGGYVKMLGQDDSDPAAVSDAPDSFQSAPVWKRMVVISAGVVFNVVLAAALFVAVFSRGLLVDRAVVGEVGPGSPAALAVAANAPALGVREAGLHPGDQILSANGRPMLSFHRLTVETALARPGRPVALEVRRAGLAEPLRFDITPREDANSRRLELGITPAYSGRVADPGPLPPAARARLEARLAELGLAGIKPGMHLVGVNGTAPDPVGAAEAGVSPYAIDRAANAPGAAGAPVRLTFATPDGATVEARVQPRAALQVAAFAAPGGSAGQVLTSAHLLGLTPVMSVDLLTDEGTHSGLRAGDIFARLGDLVWPSAAEGVAEVRRPVAGKERTSIRVVVSRALPGQAEARELIDLGDVKVHKGRIGFYPGHSAHTSNLLARWPRLSAAAVPGVDAADQRTDAPDVPAGARLVAVGGVPTATLADAREALRAALAAAVPDAAGTRTVPLDVALPAAAAAPGDVAAATVPMTLRVDDAGAARLASLRWVSPIAPGFFEPDQTLQRGDGVVAAIALGAEETRYAMLSTYITLARLFQGTVKVEHLNGPVGIAHVGTLLADRGLIWLLFFMAVVSVNLAVINFLPVPIVDGGHMVYLAYELLTGRRVSVLVQNIATMAGLAVVGTAFLVVTYNDLARLLGP